MNHISRRYVALTMMLVFCFAVQAQTAKVIPLSTADAVEAKRLYTEMTAAKEAWDKFEKRIQVTYATEPKRSFRFEFDESFRFLVPRDTLFLINTNGAVLNSSYWPKSRGTVSDGEIKPIQP